MFECAYMNAYGTYNYISMREGNSHALDQECLTIKIGIFKENLYRSIEACDIFKDCIYACMHMHVCACMHVHIYTIYIYIYIRYIDRSRIWTIL